MAGTDERTSAPAPTASSTASTTRLGRHPGWVEAVLLVLAAVSVVWTLNVGDFRGMGDNGDYGRVRQQLGLTGPPGTPNQQHRFVGRYYVDIRQTAGWRHYPTSLVPVARVVRAVDNGITGRHGFDLNSLGLAYLAAFLGVLYALLRAGRRLDPRLRLGLALLGLFVLTDFAYVGYFHSMFGEPIGYLGLLGSVGGGVLWGASGLRSRGALAVLTVSAVFLATAKTAYASIAMTVAVVLVAVAVTQLRHADRQRAALAGVAGLAIVLGAAWSVLYAPQDLRTVQLWEVTMYEVVPYAPDRVAAARELGLDPALVAYVRTTAHGRLSPINQKSFRARFPKYTPTQKQVLAYYAHHPRQFAELMWRGRSGFSEMRPDDIGTTTHAAPGGGPVLTGRRAGWSSAVHHAGRLMVPLTLLTLATATIAPLVAWRRERRRRRAGAPLRYGPAARGGLVVLAALGLTAIEQYVTILLSDGRFELPKHLFLFHLMTQLALLGLLAWGGSVALAKRGGPPPEGGESPSDAPLEPVTAA